MINNVRSAPGYGSTRIIYIREPHRLEYYAFHTWADSPASMLHPIFVRAAEQSGLFTMVVTPASPTQENLRLDMQLVSLKQRMDGDSSQVELRMRALLFGGDTLLGSRLFEFKEPAVSNPVAGVNAANAAVSKLTGALFEWIATVITAENPRCPPESS
jgi:cholesterol transport system auxiliary component